MARKKFDWVHGVALDEHSRRKLEILRKYFREYLITRCQLPRRKLRLAIIDGFSGGGKYQGDISGSPLIFLEVLKATVQDMNVERAAGGLPLIDIECFLVFNDSSREAIKLLEENVAPLIAEIDGEPHLDIEVAFRSEKFEKIYPEIKSSLSSKNLGNVLFNLDQPGYSTVDISIIKDIMMDRRAPEVFLTFSIGSFLAYISPDRAKNRVPVSDPDLHKKIDELAGDFDAVINKAGWLGALERVVFEHLKDCAPFVSPFSINNPRGRRYWMMHFSGSDRARQVYNDVLHAKSGFQAHYGRAGLNMLSYDPRDEGLLYEFNGAARRAAKEALPDDIARAVRYLYSDGVLAKGVLVEDFYGKIYNETPAHSDDINEAILENDDTEVVTKGGGSRQKSDRIKRNDILRLKRQISMSFPSFSPGDKNKK